MNRKSYQRKLKEIADKHGVSLATANEVVRSQWLFIQSIITSANKEIDYYPIASAIHLGKFVVTPQRQWVINNVPGKKLYNRRNNDTHGHEVLQSFADLSGDAEEHTFETVQGEDTVAG